MIDLPIHLLPPTLRDIADQCGQETALLLLEKAGGGRVLVPRPENLGAGHPLVEWLGQARAEVFCRQFSGEYIAVPVAQAALRKIRNRQIRSERDAGASLFTLARRHGMTERNIMKILSAEIESVDQSDLFDID